MTLQPLKAKHTQNRLGSSFILKCYKLLQDQAFTDIVDWNMEGTAIMIKEPFKFAQIVLPIYFKHNKLTSFIRQLNMYDFRKSKQQMYDLIYSHDFFQRDKQHLFAQIKRKNKQTKLANIQSAIQELEIVRARQRLDSFDASSYENQELKKLSRDALNRISALSSQVEQLKRENWMLWNQINHQDKKRWL